MINGIEVKYSARGLSDGLNIDEDTGVISGTPKTMIVGTLTIVAKVIDGNFSGEITNEKTNIDIGNVDALIDGSNWPGRMSGQLKYSVDSIHRIVTYTLSYSYVAQNLVIPSLVLYGDSTYKVEIGDRFFGEKNNDDVEGTLTFSDGIAKIGYMAFNNCSKLVGSLIIPNSIEEIGVAAFYGCSGFNGVLKLSNNPNFTEIGQSAFGNTGFTGDLIIPNNIISIGIQAFENCSGFNGQLFLSSNLTSIYEFAFANNHFIGELVIPFSVISIDLGAFMNSDKIIQLEFLRQSSSEIEIGTWAFGSWKSTGGIVYVPIGADINEWETTLYGAAGLNTNWKVFNR